MPQLLSGMSAAVTFSVQWQSWESCETEYHVYGHDPWMLSFTVFVFGTELEKVGRNLYQEPRYPGSQRLSVSLEQRRKP
jgi:hypothetical protein